MNNMQQKPILSSIITAHDEGILAHKTMLSMLEALDDFEQSGYSWELIIHIDNGSKDTLDYFSRYKNDKKIKIFTNNFGNPAASRNFAAEQARGKYCAFLDGDDLVSKNWFVEAYKVAEKHNKEVLVHPEANLTFGIGFGNVLWLLKKSLSKAEDAIVLAGANRWPSIVFGKRSIFAKHKYPTPQAGYGNEDWHFNTETVADGIKHVIAPGTIQFYRKKRDSVLTRNESQNNIQPYSELLDLNYLKTLTPGLMVSRQEIKKNHRAETIKRNIKQTYINLRNIRSINLIITPLAEIGKKITGKTLIKSLPRALPAGDFIIQECQEIAHIEPQLYPTTQMIGNISFYDSEQMPVVGEALINLSKSFTKRPDYVFIVPWLTSGGADKVILNYIDSIKRLKPEWTVAVITTLPSKNVWQNKLPSNAFLLDFGNITKELNDFYKDLIFSRLITQLQCKKLHIMNSEFAYLWVGKHKALIKNHYTLNLSYFNFEYITGTNKIGTFDYADPYIIDIIDSVNMIYTDNQAIIERAIKRCGFNKSKLKVHYQPIAIDAKKKKYKFSNQLRILWASRITDQKNPDLLLRIAKKLNSQKATIDVYGGFENHYSQKMFEGINAIQYKGKFDGVNSLPTEKYDLFLYTSTGDGVPNILLEMISKGMPIVASDVGGVKEVIDERTGRLIHAIEDENAYIKAIFDLAKHENDIEQYMTECQETITKRHSFKKFDQTIAKDIIGIEKNEQADHLPH